MTHGDARPAPTGGKVPEIEQPYRRREGMPQHCREAGDARDLLDRNVVVSMLVGIQTEEMRALTWDRVDLEGEPPTIAVWRSMRKSGDTKTEKSRRTLAMPQLAVDVLHRRRRDQVADKVKAGNAWQESGLVFTTTVETALDVRRRFRSALKLVLGIEPAE